MSDPVPTVLDYLRAHQYLYYVTQREVLTDHEYDLFGRWSGKEYKGGSDRAESYTTTQTNLACDILARRMPVFPREFQP